MRLVCLALEGRDIPARELQLAAGALASPRGLRPEGAEKALLGLLPHERVRQVYPQGALSTQRFSRSMGSRTSDPKEIEMNRTLLTALAALVALIALSVAGTAQAFDSNTCGNIYPATLERTDPINISAGKVDFGDHAHLFGRPAGNAVICWSTDGRVAIKGIVFSDPGFFHADNQYVTARIWFFDINAGLWRNQGSFSTTLSNSLQSRSLGGLDGLRSPAGTFSAVRIRLSLTTEGALGGLIPSGDLERTFLSP